MSEEKIPTIRVLGVPEHFNLPWHLAAERGYFKDASVNVEWTDVKEGTGEMIKRLKSGQADVILALTEGIVSDIANGSNIRLVSMYVQSPLCWAVSAGAHGKYKTIEDLKDSTIAISRYTSGSHIMACVLANNRGWGTSSLKFSVIGTFEKLRASVNDQSPEGTSAFLWETFTTKPYHDNGEVLRIGEITTPWPCFMVASTKEFVADPQNAAAVTRMLAAVDKACQAFASEPGIVEEVSKRYGNKLEDAKNWYSAVSIAPSFAITESSITKAIEALKAVGLVPVDKTYDPSAFVAPELASIRTDIGSMKLYNKPELLIATLASLRQHNLASGQVSYKQLLPFDQNHYNGTTALDECVAATGLTKGSRALNLGSSVGGPARYLAGEYGVEVTAIEIQQDLHSLAQELTQRCEASVFSRVHHICGDFLQVLPHLPEAAYDAIVSWLTILHLTKDQRKSLFADAKKVLRPNGKFFSDDFVALRELSPAEAASLRKDVFCSYLPDATTYAKELEEAGFKAVAVVDLTKEWASFIKQRASDFIAKKDEHVRNIGAEAYSGLEFFYSKVAELFESGGVGGYRFVFEAVTDREQA